MLPLAVPACLETGTAVRLDGNGVGRHVSGAVCVVAQVFRTAFLPGVGVGLFFVLEYTLRRYQSGYERNTRDFQTSVLAHQYEEIKTIYLNMRGWRHDYHNHIQVMKAHMALGQMEALSGYLDALEQELSRVDAYVKSGNLMIDAILNSKLSLARQQEIALHCTATLPERLSISDVDLCVILGNLLDNAIEACEKIAAEERFLRIYCAVIKNQLYISVQNSAKEELDFDERNYISKNEAITAWV